MAKTLDISNFDCLNQQNYCFETSTNSECKDKRIIKLEFVASYRFPALKFRKSLVIYYHSFSIASPYTMIQSETLPFYVKRIIVNLFWKLVLLDISGFMFHEFTFRRLNFFYLIIKFLIVNVIHTLHTQSDFIRELLCWIPIIPIA